MSDQPVLKAADPAMTTDSVQSRAHETAGSLFGVGLPGINRLFSYLQKSELDIPPYGYAGRGPALRRVWRLAGADIIASALAVMIQKVQATGYSIEGPQRTVIAAQRMIDNAELGAGWLQFVARWVIDYCCQDNGAMTEILGPGKPLRRFGKIVYHRDGTPVIDPALPIAGRPVSLSQMDSQACERTGISDTPIRYYDLNGNMYLMNWSRVHFVADMPQPEERLFGYGFCALSRCISMVQYSINWATMRNESLDNMPPLSIMALENINKDVYEQQMAAYEADQLTMGQKVLRILMTLVSQDPTKPTDVKLHPIRQLWESFDEQKAFQITVNVVAMAFGLDPQDLAPLVSTGMGSGAQSTVLDEKAHGKGVGNLLTQLEALAQDVLPASCTLRFDRKDDDADLKRSQIVQAKATTIKSLAEPLVTRLGAADPNMELAPGNPIDGLISRDEARQILMYEVPEWAGFLDPTGMGRDQVVVDELSPEVADRQEKLYGPRTRFNSKTRQMVILGGRKSQPTSRWDQTKAQRVRVDAITPEELAESKRRLAAIGINVDELRPAHARA